MNAVGAQNGGRGYLELPYTLAQDSTLFLFLEQRSNEIWKRKLEWIAQKGGMALLNVHPDYINFEGENDPFLYSVEHYADFLKHVKCQYRGLYWNGLPIEVADHFADSHPYVRMERPSRNICMLAATHYDTDARVSRYARTLAARGDHVDVIACRPDDQPLRVVEQDGVTLHEITRVHEDRKRGPLSHLLMLLRFFVASARFIHKSHRKQPYDLIHVHNIPEWLVFAAWLPKRSRSRILLDIHDLVPELFLAKFKKGGSSVLGPILRAAERVSCEFADHVIISNHLWKFKLIERSVPKSKCSVFFNNIDLSIFYPRPRTREDDRKIVLFHGSLQWHQGLDIAIRAFAILLEKIPCAEFHVYGCGGEKNNLIQLSKELGLEEKVIFFPLVSANEIPQIIANADLGIVPKRVDSFGNEAYSTKIMEFMSQGVPVVISRTAIDCYYFNDQQVRFCESGNVEAFAAAMAEVLTDSAPREQMIRNSNAYVALNHWGTKKQEYLDLVDRLIESKSGGEASTEAGIAPVLSADSGDRSATEHLNGSPKF